MSAQVAAVGLQRQQLVQASSSRSVALTAIILLLFRRRPPKTKLRQSKKQSSSRLRSGVCGVEPGGPERGALSGWASAVADASRASAREPNHRTAPDSAYNACASTPRVALCSCGGCVEVAKQSNRRTRCGRPRGHLEGCPLRGVQTQRSPRGNWTLPPRARVLRPRKPPCSLGCAGRVGGCRSVQVPVPQEGGSGSCVLRCR